MLHESLQLELKHVHKAKKVRLTLAIPSFIQTPLLGGSHNFILPLLDVRTRGAPEWVLRMARESTMKIPVDFKGRQVVDGQGRRSPLSSKNKEPRHAEASQGDTNHDKNGFLGCSNFWSFSLDTSDHDVAL
ncbi:hypothetical protein QBC45DRAFT_396042 [Copromyces sp. CBS 386.78]|nr:hypothetical protein QBC45DRAFT_396042 [Copromyces sp. CBS 386.78]